MELDQQKRKLILYSIRGRENNTSIKPLHDLGDVRPLDFTAGDDRCTPSEVENSAEPEQTHQLRFH